MDKDDKSKKKIGNPNILLVGDENKREGERKKKKYKKKCAVYSGFGSLKNYMILSIEVSTSSITTVSYVIGIRIVYFEHV